MKRLEQMKESLISCVQSQISGNLQQVDAKELGEAIDMIKDLEEAIYYCTITKAMNDEESWEKKGHQSPMYYQDMGREYYPPHQHEQMSNEGHRMYSRGTMYMEGNSGGNDARGGGTRGYRDGMIRRYDDGQMSYSMYNDGSMYHDPMGRIYRDGMMQEASYPMMRDPREGRSGERRKMYMEGKGMKDKSQQMKELENYMQELSQDVTEMIQDASPEEKQMLQQKIQMLASKIK